MRTDSLWPPLRFFLVLGLVLLLLAALWLGLVYGPASYAAIEHLRHVRYHDGDYYRFRIPLTPAGYQLAKTLLLGGLAVLLALVGGLSRKNGLLRQEWQALRREWRLGPPLLAPWRRLRPIERGTALALLGLLTLLRLWYVLQYPLYGDEVVSYYSFVREGAVAVTGFYPIPNNHIGYSALCWLLSLLSTNFYWTMRLPTFLLSTLGTGLVGLLLLRHVGFRVAALTVLLFGFFPYALLQSVIGRGYFLLALSGQLAFVAGLALLRGTRRPRLAWATLAGCSVVGFYAIPTFLLGWASLYAALGLIWLARRRWAGVRRLVLTALLTALPVLLLYAPVVLVSGPKALFSNGYVAPRPGHDWLADVRFAQHIEGQLLGMAPLGLWPALALSLLALTGLAWRPARRWGRMVVPAVLALWLPYGLLAAREVYPPTRVLAYKVFFLLLLGALLLDVLLRVLLPRLASSRLGQLVGSPLLTVAVPVLLWAGAGLVPFQRRASFEAARNGRVADTLAWLRRHQAHRVLVNQPHYQVYLRYYAEINDWPLRIYPNAVPGLPYDVQLRDKTKPAAEQPGLPLLLDNPDVLIYPAPAAKP